MSVNEVISQEGTITVRRTAFGQEVEDRETIEIRPFATTPAVVTVKRGQTINLGNYESARVDVSISMPCYREEVRQVFSKVSEQTDKLLEAEVSTIGLTHGLSLAAPNTPSIEEML